jgi:NAD(P)-dependent dehydrogenase (short-subunit alcohol dehydrogenase family)
VPVLTGRHGLAGRVVLTGRVVLMGRVVAVTGGARGIGLAIATALAAAGARVALGDLDDALAAQRAAALRGIGGLVDVRDAASFGAFLGRVERELGPLDVLVNNAGVAIPGDYLGTSAAEHDLQFEVNIRGVEHGMRLALPGMLARGRGHVVNVASAAGLIPAPGAAVYTATKHAVVGLTHAVRSELRGTGVHVSAVLPTAAGTEMAAGLHMRGLPQVSPELVARRVVRVVSARRPPATIMVPRWLRPVAVIDAASPQWLRDLARRWAVVQVGADRAGREAYAKRVARQLDRDEPA